MQDEYGFSDAEPGKYYRSDAIHQLPMYLEPEVLGYFSNRAMAKRVERNVMINELLKRDIESIEAEK